MQYELTPKQKQCIHDVVDEHGLANLEPEVAVTKRLVVTRVKIWRATAQYYKTLFRIEHTKNKQLANAVYEVVCSEMMNYRS